MFSPEWLLRLSVLLLVLPGCSEAPHADPPEIAAAAAEPEAVASLEATTPASPPFRRLQLNVDVADDERLAELVAALESEEDGWWEPLVGIKEGKDFVKVRDAIPFFNRLAELREIESPETVAVLHAILVADSRERLGPPDRRQAILAAVLDAYAKQAWPEDEWSMPDEVFWHLRTLAGPDTEPLQVMAWVVNCESHYLPVPKYPFKDDAESLWSSAYFKRFAADLERRLADMTPEERVAYLVRTVWQGERPLESDNIFDRTNEVIAGMNIRLSVATSRLVQEGPAGILAMRSLIEAADDDERMRMVRYFAKVHDQHEDQESIEALWEIVERGSLEPGDSAWQRALHELGDRRAHAIAPRLLELLLRHDAVAKLGRDESDHRYLLGQAIPVLGKIGDRSALDYLVEVFEENGSLRSTAAGAIAEQGDPGALELVRYLGSPDKTVRVPAFRALIRREWRSGTRDYVNGALATYRDSHPSDLDERDRTKIIEILSGDSTS